MELEVEGLTGAACGEKSPERLVQRNGYRERDWETADTVELRIQAAPGTYFSRLPGAAPDCREGADSGGAGGLSARRFDTSGR